LKRIADLKKSSFFLEQKSGAMLSRDQAFGLVRQMIEIIVDELYGIPDYERIVDSIVARILATVQHAGNSETESE
jgi:hypothetical protein